MSDRDQHVDRLLREAMAGPVRAESADCLDIETLAAWSEGSLRADERARAETHAATCTRCQSTLAAMVRTQPIVAAASPSFFRKWLVVLGPALGAAAAVALWFAVDPSANRQRAVDTIARSGAHATVPQPSDVPKTQEERKGAATTEPHATSSFQEQEADKLRKDADQRLGADAKRKTLDRADAQEKPSDAPQLRDRRRAEVDEGRRVAEALPAPMPLPPPPPAAAASSRPLERTQAEQVQRETVAQNATQAANQQPANQGQSQGLPSPSQSTAQQNAPQQNAGPVSAAPVNQPGERTVNETAAAKPAAPAITPASQPTRNAFTGEQAAGRGGQPAGAAGAGGGVADSRLLGLAGAVASAFDVPSSTPSSTRYRALFGRNIQRSTDSGATWTTVRTLTPPTSVVAGASPSPTVCWLAASGGIVLTTSDGVTWRETKLPEPGEIKSITAVDAKTATVTLTDGRLLTTINGGTSWARPR